MLELLVQNWRVFNRIELTINLKALESGPLPLGDFLTVFALAAADDGGQQIDALALRQGRQLVDHHGDSLALNGQTGGGRIGHTDPCPEQTHIVVNLSHCADSRPGIAAGGFLLDGDSWGQALD